MDDRQLFGTDGIRGLAGQYPLDPAGAERVGRAVGTRFAEPGQSIILGRDPRESSEPLSRSVIEGLNAVGVDVVEAGILPTPGLAYLTREGDFAAGVMITASHNPYRYNGIKVFDNNGDKLPDSAEADLNRLIESDLPARGNGSSRLDAELIKKYEDFLVASAAGTSATGLKIAIDSANGAASGLAERVFKRLGAQVTCFADKPDGRNINLECGATDTAALRRTVSGDGFDLGIALDGDADRAILIDNQGREFNGDHLMYMLAAADNLEGVVATVMSNLGLERALSHHGIKLERTQIGDRYVLEGLKRTGFHLGGEQSGHVILPDMLKTGDGLLTAVQAIKVLATNGKTLAEWRNEVDLLPQALVNMPLTDPGLLNKPAVQAFIKQETDKLAGDGRLLIRPSGTEPLVRVMVEAPDAEAVATDIADSLKGLIAS